MISSRSLIGVRDADLRDQRPVRVSRVQPATGIRRPVPQLPDDLPVGRPTLRRRPPARHEYMPRHLLHRRPPTRRRMGDLRGQQPGMLAPVHAGFRDGLQSLRVRRSAGHASTIPRNRPGDLPPRRAAQGEWSSRSGRARCVCARRSFRHSCLSSGTCRPVQGALDSGGGPIREPVNEPGPAARAVRPDVPSGRRPAGRAIHADSLTPSRYVYKAPETIVTIRLGGS